MDVSVTALAGGVGAGKFLRGLARVIPPDRLTAIVNTGDDLVVHGLFVSPDLDSVTYWLGGVMDRDRGWGRAGETFRATEELRAFDAPGSWFGLGDLDLATHLFRTRLLAEGHTLAEATARVAGRFGIEATLLPMSEDRVQTRVDALAPDGSSLDLDFQEYWVLRGAADEVKAVRYEGADRAGAAEGVIASIERADAVLICPSNPIASIGPILAVPGIREALAARRETVAGVSPIVGGAVVRGMADRLLPSAGVEVTAAGVAGHYADVVGAWVVDEVDAALAGRVRAMGLRVSVVDTMMVDDDAAARVAAAALSAALAGAPS